MTSMGEVFIIAKNSGGTAGIINLTRHGKTVSMAWFLTVDIPLAIYLNVIILAFPLIILLTI